MRCCERTLRQRRLSAEDAARDLTVLGRDTDEPQHLRDAFGRVDVKQILATRKTRATMHN